MRSPPWDDKFDKFLVRGCGLLTSAIGLAVGVMQWPHPLAIILGLAVVLAGLKILIRPQSFLDALGY